MANTTSSASITLRCLDTPQGTPHEVPIELFVKSILPPLHSGLVVDEVVRKLEKSGKKSSPQKPVTLKGRWRGFAVDPESARESEKTSFRNLEPVFRSILKAAVTKVRDCSSPLCFRNNSACIPRSWNRCSDTFPDAYWLREAHCSWSNIAVSGEYKKGNTNSDEHDNAVKVTTSMFRCMRRDPCRRFTFGFTIENTNMKLWFCDRAQLLCSTPFNFILDRKYLVHFCLSIAYAEPQQLGWDPTMVLANDRRQYDITVFSNEGEARVYRTLDLLSDSGAQVLIGRGTRVWKVVQIENGQECGSSMVLKDAWVDFDRKREGTALEELRAAEYAPYCQEDFDRAYLSREVDGDVFSDAGHTIPDSTHVFGAEDVQESHRTSSPSASGRSSTSFAPPFPAINRKVHYRVVFREVCRSISSETSLATILRALAQIVTALHLMHLAGWVHRDVSAGNMLITEDGVARLTDLEYAHRVGEDDEARLGTAKFMATEVDLQEYIFSRNNPLLASPRRSKKTTLSTSDGSSSSSFKLPSPPGPDDPLSEASIDPTFRYNALHDLESLWWVAVYTIFTREVEPTSDDECGNASEEQRAYAANMFDTRVDRFHSLATVRAFQMKIFSLHPSIRHVGHALEKMRQALLHWYYKAEVDLDAIDHTGCAEGLYDVFRQCLTITAERSDTQCVRLRPSTTTSEDRRRADVDHAPVPSQDGEDWAGNNQTAPAQDETNRLKRKSSSDDAPSATAAKKAKTVRRRRSAEAVRTRLYLPRGAKRHLKS
ncbi:hypothetical protein NM688_g392 [Phlebia brevispora]|uniref:Uncharacterized protein n=1 Tax=Phlebia brevispora TaxID=194682 RepID=A0ACC1TEK9_9APHY|nr:hypothetical protein NM688_g392 [Phlebia brevispora]